MLVGKAVNDISQSFDEYWNHSYAYDVREIVNQNAHRLSYESLKQQLDEHYKRATVQNYLDLTGNSQAIDSIISRDIPLNWVKAEVVKDSPDKIKSKAKKQEHLNFQLINHLEQPEKNIDLISAYFVPEKRELKFSMILQKMESKFECSQIHFRQTMSLLFMHFMENIVRIYWNMVYSYMSFSQH